MQHHPMQLEGYFVSELRFNVVPEVVRDLIMSPKRNLQSVASEVPNGQLMIEVEARFDPLPDPSRSQIILGVRSNRSKENGYPYEFSIQVVGHFHSLYQPVDSEDSIRAQRTNGVSLLYSIARDAIASTTARGPLPGVLLPTLSFMNSPVLQLDDPRAPGIRPRRRRLASTRLAAKKRKS